MEPATETFRQGLEINGHTTIEIRGGGLTPKQKENLGRYADEFLSSIYGKLSRDENKIAEMKRSLLNCFPVGYQAKEVPNEYCQCCPNNIWLEVETAKGPVKIGRRKRVYEITWHRAVLDKTGYDVTTDDVTRFENGVHAWGLDKAKEYVYKLLDLQLVKL